MTSEHGGLKQPCATDAAARDVEALNVAVAGEMTQRRADRHVHVEVLVGAETPTEEDLVLRGLLLGA